MCTNRIHIWNDKMLYIPVALEFVRMSSAHTNHKRMSTRESSPCHHRSTKEVKHFFTVGFRFFRVSALFSFFLSVLTRSRSTLGSITHLSRIPEQLNQQKLANVFSFPRSTVFQWMNKLNKHIEYPANESNRFQAIRYFVTYNWNTHTQRPCAHNNSRTEIIEEKAEVIRSTTVIDHSHRCGRCSSVSISSSFSMLC